MGSNIVIAESQNYHHNFQKFYLWKDINKEIRPIPLVKYLESSQMEIILSWATQPKDLDIHLSFVASKEVLCNVDYSMKHCAGAELLTDSQNSGEKGADVVKIDSIGPYQYLVYVSVYEGKGGPGLKKDGTSLSES